MKKIITIFVLLLINNVVLFCQDNYYVNRTEKLYRDPVSFEPIISHISELHEGEAISIISPFIGTDIEIKRIKIKTENGITGWLSTDAISVKDSIALPEEITNSGWIHSYYLDVLRSGNRETLFIYEPFWRDSFYKYKDIHAMHPGYDEAIWYEEAAFINISDFKTIYNIICDLSNANFYEIINGKVSNINQAFYFSAVCIKKGIDFEETELEKQFPLNEKFLMRLSLDGDYLDVYINDKKLFTLVSLTEEIKSQFKSLMETNSCDMSKVQFPRRADGSMDYPPPRDMSKYSPTHRTLDNLRLQDAANTSAKQITTLPKDTEVQVVETGTSTTINDITAPWVKVVSRTGYTGWCFSGYLEEIKKPNIVGAANGDENQTKVTRNSKEANPLPLWAWIVITVGAVAFSVVFFLVKRKK